MIDYKPQIIFALNSLKNNKKLFLPILFQTAVTLILLVTAAFASGLVGIFFNVITNNLSPVVLISLLEQNFLRIIVSFALFFITSFVLGSTFEAMRFNMTKKIIEKKPVKVKFPSKKNTLNYIFLKFIFWLIKVSVVVVSALVFLNIFNLENVNQSIGPALLATIPVSLLLGAIVIIVHFFAYFRNASLFLDNLIFNKAIKSSFKFVKKDILNTFLVVLIIFAAGIMLSVVSFIIRTFVELFSSLSQTSMIFLPLLIISLITYGLISAILTWSLQILTDLFIFKNYKDLKPQLP